MKAEENMSNFEMKGQCIKNAIPKQPDRSPTAVCDVRSGKYTLKNKSVEDCMCKEGHEKQDSKCQGLLLHK